jgi:hypothetical protein
VSACVETLLEDQGCNLILCSRKPRAARLQQQLPVPGRERNTRNLRPQSLLRGKAKHREEQAGC